jgi:hypothetical protein
MNLIKADFFHFIKDKVFYVLIALTFIMPLFTCIMYSSMAGGAGLTVESSIFQGIGGSIFCPLVGIQLALFFGKDYANNTIRNKICYGENRYKIVLITFIESIIITLAFVVVSFLSSLIFGSVFGTFSFSSEFAAKFFCQLAILIAFSLMVTAIVMCTKSAKTGLIVTLLISVVLMAVSYLLPVLAVDNVIARIACRILYITVSNMVIDTKCVNGVYPVGSSFAFNNMYLNALLLALIYAIISVGVTLLIVRKQNYK